MIVLNILGYLGGNKQNSHAALTGGTTHDQRRNKEEGEGLI